MAEAPEEVLVDIEADDRATPALTSVGRSISVLGSTLGIVTRDLGIHNAALDSVIRGIQVLGAVVRAAGAVQRLLAMATQFLTATETENAAATVATTTGTAAYTGTAAAATAANYGLAASFAAVNAAIGPLGWVLIGLGLLAAGLAGFAAGGGFAGGGMGAAVGGGPAMETVNINMYDTKMSTKRDVRETMQDMGTLWYEQTRRYRR